MTASIKNGSCMKNFEAPMLLPGVVVDTAPDNFQPIRKARLERFNGERWELFGDLMGG